jgi:hypothetical protein
MTVSLSDETQEWAPSQYVPGTSIFSVAPALRIAAMLALTTGSHSVALWLWGSFISP